MLPGVRVSRVEEEELRGAWARALSRVLGGPLPHALLLSASSSSSSPPSGEGRTHRSRGKVWQCRPCLSVWLPHYCRLVYIAPFKHGDI